VRARPHAVASAGLNGHGGQTYGVEINVTVYVNRTPRYRQRY
jgi:hypothetical protein